MLWQDKSARRKKIFFPGNRLVFHVCHCFLFSFFNDTKNLFQLHIFTRIIVLHIIVVASIFPKKGGAPLSKQIVSEDSIGFMLGQTYRKIVYLLSSRLKEFDITTEQFSLLYQLDKQDGINQKELAHRTSKDQPTTTRILDALYKKGLIHKKTSENDRRAFLLFLTDAGKEMVKQTLPIEQQTIQEALHNISDADLAFMKQLLQQMSENAQKQIES